MAITDWQHQQLLRQPSAAATATPESSSRSRSNVAGIAVRARYRSNLRLSPAIVHGVVCRSLEI